jgi:GH15 family glucan-1,4-alpha-glucosidase
MDYGIIGNCKSAALISKDGSINWCCLPRFDSPSVFAKILDNKKGGSFSIRPVGRYTVRQKYIKDTNVLETTFNQGKNSFRILDFFPRYSRGKKEEKENKVYRIIKLLKGKPRIRIIFDPRLDYSRGRTRLAIIDGSIVARTGKKSLFLHSNLEASAILHQKSIVIDHDIFFIIHTDDVKEKKYNLRTAKKMLEKTTAYWKEFVREGKWPNEFRDEVVRSALVLKLLTYDESGAIVAAATTSIPEEIGTEKNWDYRYCWLRDGSFTISALTRIGHYHEAEAFMEYMRENVFDKVTGLKMQVLYGVEGERKLNEKLLYHLSGYKNSLPVRIGNAAYKQKQIDIAGEIIDAIHRFYVYHHYIDNIDEETWKLVCHLVDYITSEWELKDHGIWELRNRRQHFTHSKVLCWAAIDKAIFMAKHFGEKASIREWKQIRDRIKEDIMQKAYDKKKKTFTMFYGGKELDAALLLMPYYHFIDARDERMISTIKAIEEELGDNELLIRFNYKEDIGYIKTAFLICSFWLVNALYSSGQKRKAKRYFRRLLKYSNHLGLFSECIDPKTKELLGNFPQAYTHIELINNAILLSK